ncbi:MAG: 3-phosphoshikimate 1-carboxyvinyltransferase [Pirellulales bacterium]|nr:3-phosphoshikimate 1-carboxyvinyltransferase [Pirellulales bacterium]
MNKTIEIQPTGPLNAVVRPPGSKSITNRALVCAALAEGRSRLDGVLDSEDTRVMIAALQQLGLEVKHDALQRTIEIAGCGGGPTIDKADLYVANSGTTVRFLTAMVAAGQGTFRLDGTPRMRERPIRPLLEALAQLGVDAMSENDTDCPPVVVRANGLSGGRATIAGDISSQYLSGLLMAAPAARGPIEIAVSGELVSKPYIEMTLAVMRSFGVSVAVEKLSNFKIDAPCPYRACEYSIEPDASAASYFFAAAAVTGGRITVEGLSRDSLQGDVKFCDCLQQMGCRVEYAPDSITVEGGHLRGIEVDMNAISDTVQTLSAVALFADRPTLIHNVAHIRHKETDRISALATELRKFGADVEEGPDRLKITPPALSGNEFTGAEIDTYDDHRMAMSLAVVGLVQAGVIIRDPQCTGKTYPEFFEDLAGLAEM